MMKGQEWIDVVNARNKYAVGTTSWLQAGELANYKAGSEIVWLDQVIQKGTTQDYQLAVSGAAQNVNYYLSTSFNDNKGLVVGDWYNHLNILAKVNTKVTSWLELGVDGSFSKRDYSGNSANIGSAEIMSTYGVMYRDSIGNLEKYPYTQSLINPLWGLSSNIIYNTDVINNFRMNAYGIISVPWVRD